MYAVEHYYENDESSTYEIFETLEKAKKYCTTTTIWNKNNYPIRIFKADFNINRIFKEPDGQWNYDDFWNTILKYYDFEINLTK